MKQHFETLRKIMQLDTQAAVATADQRSAENQLKELGTKTLEKSEVIKKTFSDILFHEGESRRKFKRGDELEERKVEKINRLAHVRTDDEHRNLKRQIDNTEREARDNMRKAQDNENSMEELKQKYWDAQAAIEEIKLSASEETTKAEAAKSKSEGTLSGLSEERNKLLATLDARVQGHYRRLAQVTRSANGPVTVISEKACGNCHMSLSPQIVNTVNAGRNVEFCPSCHHILLPEPTEG